MKAFDKSEECVFVLCLNCYEEKMKKVGDKRCVNKTNISRRRGNRGRAAGGGEVVNVCKNLKNEHTVVIHGVIWKTLVSKSKKNVCFYEGGFDVDQAVY